MYSLLLQNENDDYLLIELEKSTVSKYTLVDEDISDVKETNEYLSYEDDEEIELSFIHRLEPFDEVYELKTINNIRSLHKLNKLALKYERCILVKLAMSSPFDLRCFALCSRRRDDLERPELKDNQFLVNNINQIKSFIRLLLAYKHNCSKYYDSYIHRRECYRMVMNGV